MVDYKDLGLVNTREMFKKAIAGQYAIAAFNFNNMEQMQAIIQAAVETKSPVILQVSSGASWAAPIRRSCCTSITATRSSFANRASTWASRR